MCGLHFQSRAFKKGYHVLYSGKKKKIANNIPSDVLVIVL